MEPNLTYTNPFGERPPLAMEQQHRLQVWTAIIVNHPERLANISQQISEAVDTAAKGGALILPKTADEIAERLRTGMAALIPAIDIEGRETFHYFRGMSHLIGDLALRREFPVVEGGTLIANPTRRHTVVDNELYRSHHVIQLSNDLLALPDNALIIDTTRSPKSWKAELRAGAVGLRRVHFPMLDALTCDPDCADGSDGSNTGIHNVVATSHGDCIQCSVNESFCSTTLPDACQLMTPSPARAWELEQALQQRFNGRASELRASIFEEDNREPTT